MLANKAVAKEFASRRPAKSRHMESDGQVLRSYYHYIMGIWIGFRKIACNADGSSNTTNRHMSHMHYALSEDCMRIWLSSGDMECLKDIIGSDVYAIDRGPAVLEAKWTEGELSGDLQTALRVLFLCLEIKYPRLRRRIRRERRELDTWISRTRMLTRL